MKKLFIFISIVSLIVIAPLSGAFAGHGHHNHHNNGSSAYSESGSDATASNVGTINVNGVSIEAAEQKDITRTLNDGSGYRGFAPQAEITYPGMPSYFGPAVRNGNVRGVKSIIMYKDTFTRADVQDLLKGVRVDANSTVPKVDNEDDTATVKVVLIPPEKADVLRQCAVINAQATKEDASSVNALAAAISTALDVGADTLLITAEGAGCKLKSNGWGIGLAWTTSIINSAENTGSTGSGGMGITGGTAGYHSLPWIQGIALDLK